LSRTGDGGRNKINNCFGTVYMFDPAVGDYSMEPSVKCILPSTPLFATLPGELKFEIPKRYLLPSDHPAVVFDGSCQVCGNPCRSFDVYLNHLQASDDTQHDIEYENISEQITASSGETLSLNGVNVIRKIAARGLQFIVLVEGNDPITTDKIQVQKIYTPTLLMTEETAEKSWPPPVEVGKFGEAIINYASFL